MYAESSSAEFVGRRSSSYRSALSLYPQAWLQDIEMMNRFLQPCPGQTILDVGAGSGYFSRAISKALGPEGRLVVVDPSADQLDELRKEKLGNVTIHQQQADRLDLPIKEFDSIWSRGVLHHVSDKTSAFRCFSRHAGTGGRLVISDIFAGTQLARYFDGFVARSCATGHEVAYLSREFAETLCHLTGWLKPEFHEVIIPWEFDSPAEIGEFLRLLFAATQEYSAEDCFNAAEVYLGVSPTRNGYVLMWPTTLMVSRRGPRALR
jgi:SAM-dependent methyltransferase